MRFHLFKWSCLILFTAGLCAALAAPVPKGRATDLANGWLREGQARLGKKMNSKVHEEVPYRDEAGDVSFYAIQLVPQGLIIVSADDVIEPVVAFSDSGTTNDLVAGNPLFAMLSIDLPERNKHARAIESAYAESQRQRVNNAKPSRRPEHAQKNKNRWEKYANPAKVAGTKGAAISLVPQPDPTAAAADEPVYDGLPSVSDMRIAPILSSVWSQTTAQGLTCYNYYTPNNYYAGCIATCMAQLMRYWQTPASAYGHNYVYSDMPLNPQQGTLTLVNRMAIGHLLADCGTAVNMQYSATESSATFSDARNALVSVFGFSNAKYWYTSSGIDPAVRNSILQSNLEAGYPVLTGIRKTSNNAGHAVVTDGFGYSSSTLYFHVNYGWGGTSDGWYNMPIMSPTAYDMVDLLVYNIFTTGTGEIIAGRIGDSNGVALQGVTITAVGAGTNYTATSDSTGYYGIRVPGGYTYTLTASKQGFIAGGLSGVVIAASSSYYAPNVNNSGANVTLAADPAQAIPVLGEWGMAFLAAIILICGARSIWQQQTRTGRV